MLAFALTTASWHMSWFAKHFDMKISPCYCFCSSPSSVSEVNEVKGGLSNIRPNSEGRRKWVLQSSGVRGGTIGNCHCICETKALCHPVHATQTNAS